MVVMLLSSGAICAQSLDALAVGAGMRMVARDTTNSRPQRQFIARYGGVQRNSLYFQV